MNTDDLTPGQFKSLLVTCEPEVQAIVLAWWNLSPGLVMFKKGNTNAGRDAGTPDSNLSVAIDAARVAMRAVFNIPREFG